MRIPDVLETLQRQGAFRSEEAACVAIHNFVRDEIAFGFTAGFEGVTPEHTLALRRGHCNAQGDLFCALLHAAGIPARLRFVALDKRVLLGAVPLPVYYCLPTRLFHAVSQVRVAGRWWHTDSYLFRPAMLHLQKQRLAESGLTVGFGLTAAASGDWDARQDSFSQANAGDLEENNLVFATLAEALAARAGNNRLFGIHFNRWLSLVPLGLHRFAEGYLNSRLLLPEPSEKGDGAVLRR